MHTGFYHHMAIVRPPISGPGDVAVIVRAPKDGVMNAAAVKKFTRSPVSLSDW